MNALVKNTVIIAIFCLAASIARAGAVSWVPDADGLWLTPTNWSSNPALPGSGDDVTISPPGDRLITLSGGSTQTIKSLVSNDRLAISGSTLAIGFTGQFNNTVTLTSSGTIKGGNLSTSGAGAIVVNSGVLDGVAITPNSVIDVASVNGAQLSIYNDLLLYGSIALGKVDGTTYGQMYFGNTGVASGTVAGTGTITLGGYGNNNTIYNYSDLLDAAGTLTIGSGITIHGKNGRLVNRLSTGTIRNLGTIAADVSGGTINILDGTGAFVNQGTLSATNGGTMTLTGAWSSTGTLNLGTGSTLNLDGTFTQAGMGTFTRSGGTVNLVGALNGNLALNATTGSWNVSSSGTLSNGVYSASGGSSLVVTSGVLVGMTANGPVDLTTANGSTLTVYNGLVLNSTVSLGKADGSTYGQVLFGNSGAASGAITGTGTIVLGGYGTNNTIFNYSNQIGANGTLTIGNGITIRGKSGRLINQNASGKIVNQGTIAADVAGGTINIGNANGTFVNQGTLSALNGGTLTISGAWSGSGAFNLGAGSTLNLDGTFTQADLGTLTRTGGTVNLTGLLTGNLALDAGTGNWNFNTGIVRNGTFTTSGGAALIISSGTFDNVVANAPVDLASVQAASLTASNGLALNSTLSLGKADGTTYGQIYFGSSGNPAGTLSGTGTIVLGGYGVNNTIYNYSDQIGAAGTLTIGSGITIHGKNGRIINNYGAGTIVNQGAISADVSGGTINIGNTVGSFVNQGSLSAINGAIMSIDGVWSNAAGATVTANGSTLTLGGSGRTWSNAGTINVTNSTVHLDGSFTQAGLGTFNRTGGIVNLDGTVTGNLALNVGTGSWNMTGGTVRNGVYTSSGGTSLVISTGTLDTVTANAPLDLTAVNGGTLNAFNGLILNSTLTVGKVDGTNYGQVNFGSSSTAAGALTGTGTVLLGGYGNNNTINNNSSQVGTAGTLTIGSGITIHGKLGRVINNYAAGAIDNLGVISVDVSGGTINVGNTTGTFINHGALSALNGGTLTVSGIWANASGGTITANASTLGLGSNGYDWSNSGGITATNSTVNLDGNFTQAGLGTFNRTGGTVNLNGTVTGNLNLDAGTGSWNAVTGILRNGTLATSGGTSLVVSSATFDTMAVAANSVVDITAGNGAHLNVSGNLTLNGAINVGRADTSAYGELQFGASGAAAGTLSGAGTIVLGGYGNNNTIYNSSNQSGAAGTLTIGSGITIRGKNGRIINSYASGTILNQGTIAADVSGGTINVANGTGTFVNTGTLSAINGGTLTIAGPWSSTGTINLGATSTLNLDGSFTQSGMGTFTRSGGTVNLTGTLTGNLALNASTGSWNLVTGVVRNGVYTASGGSSLVVSSGTFDTVTANGDVDLSTVNGALLTALNGMTLNGTLALGRADGSGNSELRFGSAGSAAGGLSGSGTILLGGSNTNNLITNYSDQMGSVGTLTIGSGITVHGKFGRVLNNSVLGTIVNQGTISADVLGGTISIGNATGTFVNQGTLSALNGGTLTIAVPWSNTGTITENGGTLNLGGPITTAGLGLSGFSRTGGTVNLSGALNNTSATFALDAARGSWGLTNGGSITGGTIALSGGSRLLVSNGSLNNVIVNGDVDVSGTGLQFSALTLNGIARVNNGNFTPVGTQTLAGAATILFQGSNTVSISAGNALTLPAAVTTRGGNGTFNGSGSLINQGLISADTASNTITLSPSFLTNTIGGIIEAAGGTLTIGAGTFTNNGTIRATSGTLQINSGVALTNSPTSSVIINGGTMSFGSAATSPSLDLSVGTLAGSGNFSTPIFNWSGGGMSGAGHTVVSATSALNLSGAGNKQLSRAIDNSGTTTWSDGQIQMNSGTFNNLAGGALVITANNSVVNTGGTNLITNAGTIAKNSSSIAVLGVPFTNQAAGVVNINDGTLAFSGGGTNFGTINIAAGATAGFGGNFTHAAGSTLSGAGNINFNTTTVSLDGNLFIDGELAFNSATATVKAGATVTKLSLTGSTATVAAGGVLTVGAGGVNFGGTTNNTVTLQPSATTPGKLMLGGNVNFTASDGTAALNTADFAVGQTPGLMDLGGVTRTFTVNDGLKAIDLAVSARMMNGAITKSGAGTLRLDSPNTYGGGTTISAGALEVIDVGALGSGAVTLGDATLTLKSDAGGPAVVFGNNVNVTGDGTIALNRISLGSPASVITYRMGNLTLGGTKLSVSGLNNLALEVANVNLNGIATLDTALPLNVTGTITQTGTSGFTKSNGTAKVTIGGTAANTYTGLTRINAGSVDLNKPAGVAAVGGDLSVFGGTVKLLNDGQIPDNANVTVNNAGTLLDLNGHSDTIGGVSITGGSVTMGTTAAKSGVLRATSLAIGGGGKLDIANNQLIVDYSAGTPMASVRAAIVSGYAGGAWNGPGLLSSAAAGNAGRAVGFGEASEVLGAGGGTFRGQTVDGTAVLARYTLTGDADLSGTVDFNDLVKLAQNYNTTVSATTESWWTHGDFNYDGVVDFNDLVKLAQNYNTVLPAEGVPGASVSFGDDLARAFAASVPEPSGLSLLGGLTILLVGRRSRRAGGAVGIKWNTTARIGRLATLTQSIDRWL